MSHQYPRASAGGQTPAALPPALLPSPADPASSPRTVIRGETPLSADIRGESPLTAEAASPKLAHIDWLSFSVKPPYEPESLQWMAKELRAVFGISQDVWVAAKGGWSGYKHRINLGDYGLMAFGGKNQRRTVHVSLNAGGCALIRDWAEVVRWGEATAAAITRIDLAHDDFEAETVSVRGAVDWYFKGAFALSGRPADAHLYDDLGSGKGSTLYVGSRNSGKLCRIYEKGKQLGDKASPWCRVEVELHNKGRVIPWALITKAGNYLAGAYPCLAYLSIEQSKLATTQRIIAMSYEGMCNWLKTAGGRALYAICEAEMGDAAAVLAKVMRPGRPKRLKGLPPLDSVPT